jgi:hypothetical protein
MNCILFLGFLQHNSFQKLATKAMIESIVLYFFYEIPRFIHLVFSYLEITSGLYTWLVSITKLKDAKVWTIRALLI